MFLALRLVLALGLALAAPSLRAQDAANILFVDAVMAARAGTDPLTVRRLLDAVEGRFPETAQARAIAENRVPGLNMDDMPDDPAWHRLIVPGSVITGFRHGTFPSLGERTHPGIDIGGACDLPILAPRAGTVTRVVSATVGDAALADMGVDRARNDRDLAENTGNALVLRHDDSTPPTFTIYLHMAEAPADEDGRAWAPGATVAAGAHLGRVGKTGRATGCHLHFEARRFSGTHGYLHPVFANIYPKGDVRDDARFAADWIAPDTWLRDSFVAAHLARRQGETPGSEPDGEAAPETTATAPAATDPEPVAAPPPDTDTWGPGLVAGVELGYNPCGAARGDDACLRGLGFSDQAIAFSHAMDGDFSGSTIGASFRDLGAVDLGVAQFVGNTVYLQPLLLNGSLGLHRVGITRDLATTFRDDTSRKMLRDFPRASTVGAVSVRSHRRLPDGTQRFVVQEPVHQGCRACPILGAAISFVEIGPATGGAILRRPIGLSLDEPDNSVELTADLIRARPDELQTALNGLGYDAGQMDGYPGPQTRAALMDFQVEHCLAPTGQPDAATAQRLVQASGFDTPCAGARLPDGIDANSPLRTGIYVDDPAKCALETLPFETVHLSQRIVRPEPAGITFGHEGGCSTARTDIRDGVTLFRGTCIEGHRSVDARWRFDIRSNDSFVDLDMAGGTPRAFTRCADDSALRRGWWAWFETPAARANAETGVAAARTDAPGFSVPAHGTELRKAILDGLRPTAEALYGAPVEFVVTSLRVSDPVAFVAVDSQRPGGGAIDIADTPGFRAGQVTVEPGTPTQVQALMRRGPAGWAVVQSVVQPTEAWWLGECADFAVLFPENCESALVASGGVQAAVAADPARSDQQAAPVPGTWADDPDVARHLAGLRASQAARAFEGCAQAHGPIAPDLRRSLLAGSVLTYADRNGAVQTRAITNALLNGDRFCLDSNRAACAAYDFQLYHCAVGDAPLVNVRSGRVAYAITDVQPQKRNPVVSGRIDQPVFGASAPELAVEGRACVLSGQWKGATAVRWPGRCDRGRATGPGVLEWLRGPEVVWRTRVGPRWGMALSDGQLRFDIDLDAFSFVLDSCDQGISGYRAVGVTPPQGTPVAYFENSWIVDQLLQRAVALAQADCPVPRKGLSNIAVSIRWMNGESAVWARNYDTDKLSWREFGNAAVQTMERELKEAERIRQAQERQRAAQARADALAAQFRTRREALAQTARAFIETGDGDMEDLAAALDLDEIGTLGRLEKGVTLRLGPVEGIETVTHDGARRYRVGYAANSPFARLEQEFRAKQDFSWENWMAMTQNASPRRTRVACLFAKVSDLPKAEREVSGALLTFASDSRAVNISLSCE